MKMVCGCEKCGTLMVQEQKGIQCRCVCPNCGNHCDICIGFERPLSKGNWLSFWPTSAGEKADA